MSERPELDRSMGEHEFTRWYWTMAELQPFARKLGIAAAGPKAELTDRIAATLGGRTPARPAKLPKIGLQLTGDLTRTTEIPEGQRSTDELRTFFESEVGPAFTFNGHMRSFLLEGGTTLGDAVDHWHHTVGTPLPNQSESLEFNRFTRAWHVEHPDGTATECREAWATYRALPKDKRQ